MTPQAPAAKPAKTPMVMRTLRVPEEVWNAAAAKGAAEDPPRGISDIVRDLLTAYAR